MLYSIFLYQSESGVLIYDINFQTVSSEKVELFSSFFSAIKTFISKMVSKSDEELKNIEMGAFIIIFTSLSEIKSDLVIIADKEDYKLINKLIPKIIKILFNHLKLFIEWKGKRDDFDVLDQPLSELILSQKKLIEEKSLIERPEEFLKLIWAKKRDLTKQEKNKLIQERKSLIIKLNALSNNLKKLPIYERIIKISEKLKDEHNYLKYQEEISRLNAEIRESKIKLQYFLDRVKISMSEIMGKIAGSKSLRKGDFKDVYLNLYSFSSKLKSFTKDSREGSQWEYYRYLATRLIEKDELSDRELSELVSTLLNMSGNVEDYLN